jgi:DNA-binding response OmpR family regulator
VASVDPLHLADARGAHPVSTPLLVVEDDPEIRSMLCSLLEDEGYPILAAADGPAAVLCAQQGRPSLVILDMNLPYLNGEEVGAQLRVLYGAVLPIVVLTAGTRGIEKARAVGAAAYLPKPFDIDELLTVVWRCLDQA